MANKQPFYRLLLNDRMRKHLGINLKNTRLFVFVLRGKTYLSTDTIPKNVEYAIVTARLGYYRWYINIPRVYFPHSPKSFRLLNVQGKVLEFVL